MEIFRRRNCNQRTLHIYPDSSVDGTLYGPLSPEVVEEGGELFESFMSSQIDSDLPQLGPLVRRDSKQMKTSELSNTASRLRELATSFSHSDERRQVREMAMEISPDITGEQLSLLLLKMLTKNDRMEEVIIVTFFFCFDLVIRLLQSRFTAYSDILNMCKNAILKALGPKVQARGGWTNSIESEPGNALATNALAAGMVAVAHLGLKTLFNV